MGGPPVGERSVAVLPMGDTGGEASTRHSRVQGVAEALDSGTHLCLVGQVQTVEQGLRVLAGV